MAASDIQLTTINPRNEERFQQLRRELGVEGFGMNAMTLKPRQRGRIHSHDLQEEVYVVLEGELTLGVEGVEHTVPRYGVARVPAGVRRQLVNRGSGTLLLLALGGSGEHVGRDGHAWETWEEEGEGRSPADVPMPSDLPV